MNRYEVIVEGAGEGGYGRIDRARDTTLEREVAVKHLDPLFKEAPDERDIERFGREAKVLARLTHQNIPAIYDVEIDPGEGVFRIIFEWVEGMTLRRHLQDEGVLSLKEAQIYFDQVCSALSHAHEAGIIHRDIKPSNVIITPDRSSCYLVDFGIALRAADVSRLTTDTGIGTPGYMAPEQERGDEVSQRTDVFALGVLLYESLAGVRPTIGSYRSLTLHNQSIPPTIDVLIGEALSDDPDRRPATPRAFSERLAAALKPHASFASTLTDGSLHEIQIALSSMAEADFAALPPGQRVLVMTRLADLVMVDDESLRMAVASLLSELLRVADTSSVDDYPALIDHGVEYGYRKESGSWQGDRHVRTALNGVATSCRSTAHSLLVAAAVDCGALVAVSSEESLNRFVGRVGEDVVGPTTTNLINDLAQALLICEREQLVVVLYEAVVVVCHGVGRVEEDEVPLLYIR